MRGFAFGLLLFALTAIPAIGHTQLPAAIAADPPRDAAHPASLRSFRLESHGAKLNAVFYLPSGAGPHPTVLLLHGNPGNEQNLDLAQAMRRAGWAVMTMHYRGSWGSEGSYSFTHCAEDGAAAVAFLRAPETARRYGLQPGRIVIMGHSLGGFVSAKVGASDPDLMGVGLFAAADIGALGPAMAKLDDAALARRYDDLPGRVVGATPRGLATEAAALGGGSTFAAFAPGLARHPLLVVTAHDSFRSGGLALAATLEARHATVHTVDIDTDHSFSDARVALEIAALNWLATLPGAPST